MAQDATTGRSPKETITSDPIGAYSAPKRDWWAFQAMTATPFCVRMNPRTDFQQLSSE